MNDQRITFETAVETLAHLLSIGAHSDASTIVESVGSVIDLAPNVARLGHVSVEMTHFYLHLIHRFAFLYLNGREDEFLHGVATLVLQNMYETHKNSGGNIDEDTFYRIFNETYKKRQEEYSKYKFSREKEKSMAGYLFYEFESRIAEIVGSKNDSLVILTIHGVLLPDVNKFHEVCKQSMTGISSNSKQ